MITILITAFDAFGGADVNPSAEAVAKIVAPDGVDLRRVVLPTSFARSFDALRREAAALCPQAIICVGQAGGRAAVTPERVAINLMDASIPDNDGETPTDEPIVPGAEAAYFATLPFKRIRGAIKAAGIACELSNTAGTFVCNRVMYGALRLCATELPGTIAGFIHVPYMDGQAKNGEPSMALGDIVRALEIAVGETAAFIAEREGGVK